jgi:hypothetical protein
VAELDALAPEPGEDAALDARRRLMQQAERIRDDIARPAALGRGGRRRDGRRAALARRGPTGRRQRSTRRSPRWGRALVELGEAQSGVEDALDAMAFDPGELERPRNGCSRSAPGAQARRGARRSGGASPTTCAPGSTRSTGAATTSPPPKPRWPPARTPTRPPPRSLTARAPPPPGSTRR